MKFVPFIARRYLFSGQHKALVSAITLISIAGVALGVFALIVVLAVMEGFTSTLIEKVIGAYAHVEVARAREDSPAIDSTATLERVRSVPGVKAASPVINAKSMVMYTDPTSGMTRQTGLFIMGVDLDIEHKVTRFMENVTGNARPGGREIVMGVDAAAGLGLAEKFRAPKPGAQRPPPYVRFGEKVLVVAPRFENTPTGRSPLIRNATLAGVFQNNFPDTDQMFAYTSLETARQLFLLPDDYIDGIHLVVDNPDRVFRVRDDIQEALGPDFLVTPWPERNPMLFDALRLEKWAMFIILLLIVLVAAFNIIGTLIMVVIEKTREIGILKSMGAREAAIRRIFLMQGFIIGGVGTALGTVSGLLVCYLLKHHIKLDIVSEAYLSDSIPILVNPWTTVLVVVSSMVICVGAALYPARQAAKLDPVEALRYE